MFLNYEKNLFAGSTYPDFVYPTKFGFNFLTKKHDGIDRLKMADKNLPWGLINDKISPGSAKVSIN